MYTDRQLKIIAVLKSADGWMSGSLLRENIGVSSRTLQMDIKAINEKQSGEPLIQSNNRLGYLLKNKIALEQEQKSYGQENYVHSKQIITLLLFEKEYTSIGTISERLFFSRSSVTSDLSQVKRIISRTPGANLLVSGQYGLKIQASENVKRIMCMKTMQRTKALGLLHKQIRKDSTMNRQGIPDYIVTMRKPGENPERVSHTHETFPVDVWQNYASPVWMDIRQSDTLQKKSAREDKDERHICPLQLEVIQRCIELWTNPNDIVLDPFAGIGSVPYTAVKMGRRGIGVELKESYYKQAVNNLEIAVKGDVMECPVGQMSIEDFLTANPA